MTRWLLIVLFSLSSLNIVVGEGVSITYFYILSPLITICTRKKGLNIKLRLKKIYTLGITCFAGIGLVSVILSLLTGSEWGLRILLSCMAFMSIYTMLFVPRDISTKDFFSDILIMMVVITFVQKCIMFIHFGMDLNASSESLIDYKNKLAMHNSAFIYPPFIYHCMRQFDERRWLKLMGIGIGIVSLLLAFSRGAIVSMIAVTLYYLVNKRKMITNKLAKVLIRHKVGRKDLAVYSIFIIVALASIKRIAIYATYYATSFLNLLYNGLGESEATRIDRWLIAINETINQPIIGSGYLGIWAKGGTVGSIHSGYFDVLYKVGILGFTIYMTTIVICFMGQMKKKNDTGVAMMISLIVYMIFYEANLWPIGLSLLSVLISIDNNEDRLVE